jgi:hypothetical protein
VRRAAVSIVAILASLVLGAPANAGGGSFTDDDQTDMQNSGPPFFGYVRDAKGDAVDDAKITVTVKNLNASMIIRSDSQGHYFLRGFDKSINPADVDIACSKDGFKETGHARKPTSDPTSPVEVDCILARQ